MKDNQPIIDINTLLPLRQFMTEEQLSRYSEYLNHLEPLKPFTREEIEALEKKRDDIIKQKSL
jgi:hypothetical protein